jgi:hypothetical protein
MPSLRFTPAQDSMANKGEFVDLALNFSDVCKALERGLDGRELDELNQSVLDAIQQLTT